MNLVPAIILIVVAAIAGYILGIVDSRITASLRKKTEAESVPVVGASGPIVVESNLLGEHTVLKVTIDKTLKWHLELDGLRLESPDALSPEQRERVVNAVTQMRPWLDGKPASEAITAAQPSPELPSFKPLNISTPAQPSVTKITPKIDALRGFRSLLTNDVKTLSKPKSFSIVAMIDEVLQAKLIGSPLMDKAIRLEEGSQGEVIVCVGSQRYDGVSAVPEPEIRDIIKAAITDWEKK
jgi:hypothetical protein